MTVNQSIELVKALVPICSGDNHYLFVSLFKEMRGIIDEDATIDIQAVGDGKFQLIGSDGVNLPLYARERVTPSSETATT
jgi:hypothetical protein